MALSPNTKKLIIRIVFFLIYLLVGAAIFQAIELPHEKKRRSDLQFDTIKENFTKKYNISTEDMKRFLQNLKEALELGFDLEQAKFPNLQRWHFMNAFFFAGNVVTTIGKFDLFTHHNERLRQRYFCRFIDSRILTRLRTANGP